MKKLPVPGKAFADRLGGSALRQPGQSLPVACAKRSTPALPPAAQSSLSLPDRPMAEAITLQQRLKVEHRAAN